MTHKKTEAKQPEEDLFQAFPKYLLDADPMPCLVLVLVSDRQEILYKTTFAY